MPRDIGVSGESGHGTGGADGTRQPGGGRPTRRTAAPGRAAWPPAWAGGRPTRESVRESVRSARGLRPVPPGGRGPSASEPGGQRAAAPAGSPPPGATRVARGAPCWLSLAARDVRAAEEFYGRVLGWCHVPLLGPPGKARSLMLKAGAPVGAIGSTTCESGVHAGWMPYFAVDDVDAAVGRLRDRGATVAVGPLATPAGRAAVAAGPDGAVFGLRPHAPDPRWTVGQGPVGRLELHTRDIFAAALFYGGVLGWAGPGDSCAVEYVHEQIVVRDGARRVAALTQGAAPGTEARYRWHTSFRVADVDAAAAAAVREGGRVIAPPRGSGARREAVLEDREGVPFTVLES
ncbi:VOC family protein [Streptomyces sp. NRRL S-920]|uniref:VOC family protein n=1 Tax=Streptomyces sp. NRRL S-920 TaxID=1463921 RepID=UPI001F413C8A|nr:VOC family protein [Streptomyces sp. NRRL S-920]